MDFGQMAVLAGAAKAHAESARLKIVEAIDETESAVNDLAQLGVNVRSVADLADAFVALKSARDALGRVKSATNTAVESLARFVD